jgi:hypothetical protein
MTTPRAIAAAVLQAAYPSARTTTINAVLDELALAAVTVDIAATTPGVVTADELPRLVGDGVTHVQVAEETSNSVLPVLDAGCEIVTVVRFWDRVWEDSGRVRTLLLSRADGSELKAKFDESRAATWKAACSALGCQPDDGWKFVQGQQAVVEVTDWTARDGSTKPIVRRWVARPGSPRAVEKQAEAAAKAERAEARRSRNAQPQHGTDDQDIPF